MSPQGTGIAAALCAVRGVASRRNTDHVQHRASRVTARALNSLQRASAFTGEVRSQGETPSGVCRKRVSLGASVTGVYRNCTASGVFRFPSCR